MFPVKPRSNFALCETGKKLEPQNPLYFIRTKATNFEMNFVISLSQIFEELSILQSGRIQGKFVSLQRT